MNYPSNISRRQFELVRPILEGARQSTRPRKYDLYDLFCAVAYVLKTGCQWRQLPVDFPRWQSVYYYYRVWSEEQVLDEPSILDQCLKKLSLPYGKRISGIKRHLAVDINGLPQAIHITTANVSDCDGASAMLALNCEHLQQVKSVLVDGGYTGDNFAATVQSNLKATVQVAKCNELHKFEVLPQCWIIERSFSWLDKCRRLWKNCERHLNSSRQMIILAFLILLLKRF